MVLGDKMSIALMIKLLTKMIFGLIVKETITITLVDMTTVIIIMNDTENKIIMVSVPAIIEVITNSYSKQCGYFLLSIITDLLASTSSVIFWAE